MFNNMNRQLISQPYRTILNSTTKIWRTKSGEMSWNCLPRESQLQDDVPWKPSHSGHGSSLNYGSLDWYSSYKMMCRENQATLCAAVRQIMAVYGRFGRLWQFMCHGSHKRMCRKTPVTLSAAVRQIMAVYGCFGRLWQFMWLWQFNDTQNASRTSTMPILMPLKPSY